MNQNNHIPQMTPVHVHDYLRQLGRGWTGQGVAIELGSWLGASAVPLLEGLVEAGYNRPFYCFDKWSANVEEAAKARDQGIPIRYGQDLLPMFLENVTPIYPKIRATQGRIQFKIRYYPGDPIEICLFDAPKREPVFSIAINALKPYWIPGVTVLGLLDYYFYKRKPVGEQKPYLAPVRFIESHPGCFEKIKEWGGDDPCSCVFFKYVKKI